MGYIEQGGKKKKKRGNWEGARMVELGYKCQKLESNPQHLEFMVCCCTEHPSVSNGLWFQSIWKSIQSAGPGSPVVKTVSPRYLQKLHMTSLFSSWPGFIKISDVLGSKKIGMCGFFKIIQIKLQAIVEFYFDKMKCCFSLDLFFFFISCVYWSILTGT